MAHNVLHVCVMALLSSVFAFDVDYLFSLAECWPPNHLSWSLAFFVWGLWGCCLVPQ